MSYRLKQYKNGEWVILIEYSKVNKLTKERNFDSKTFKFDNVKYKFDVKKYESTKPREISNKKLRDMCAAYDAEFEKECDQKFKNIRSSKDIKVSDFIQIFLEYEKNDKAASNYSRDYDIAKYINKKLGKIKLRDIDNIIIQNFINDVRGMKKTIITVRPKSDFESILENNGFDYTNIRREYRKNPKNGINNSSLRNALDGKNVSIEFANRLSDYTGISRDVLFEINISELDMAYNTKKKYTAFLSKMLSYAKKHNYISFNYFNREYIDMFKDDQPNKDDKCMSFEEFTKYNEFLINNEFENKSITIANLILAETGLRKEELLGLTWDNIDLEKGVIKVLHTVTYSSNTGISINKYRSLFFAFYYE